MTAESFENLLMLCGSYLLKNSPREAIRPESRLLVTLRFLATGDSYPSLAYAFRIAPSTICGIIFETCSILWHVLSPLYLMMPTESQWLQIARDYENLWQLPNCLGSVDGKHVGIQAPSHSVCDAQYLFTHVNIGAFGAQSNEGVLKNCSFSQQLRDGSLHIPTAQALPNTNIPVPFYFVADEAFPLQINLMRPHSKLRNEIMSEEKLIFNYRLSRARRTIENTFGIFVARFRIYHKEICASPDTVDVILKATPCLHNFIKQQEGNAEKMYCGPGFVDREAENGTILPGQFPMQMLYQVLCYDFEIETILKRLSISEIT